MDWNCKNKNVKFIPADIIKRDFGMKTKRFARFYVSLMDIELIGHFIESNSMNTIRHQFIKQYFDSYCKSMLLSEHFLYIDISSVMDYLIKRKIHFNIFWLLVFFTIFIDMC